MRIGMIFLARRIFMPFIMQIVFMDKTNDIRTPQRKKTTQQSTQALQWLQFKIFFVSSIGYIWSEQRNFIDDIRALNIPTIGSNVIHTRNAHANNSKQIWSSRCIIYDANGFNWHITASNNLHSFRIILISFEPTQTASN